MERGVSAALSNFLTSYLESSHPAPHVCTTLSRIRDCRTEVMGGRRMVCPECGEERTVYNSCRDRHCPNCQSTPRDAWLLSRKEELIPIVYFHVVFTLPQELNPFVLGNMREAYNALFTAAWGTLKAFAEGKSLRMGMTALLHTWGSNLSFHPHLHCIVPGGGVDADGRWKKLPQVVEDKGKEPFLFPVKAMSKMFRAKYMEAFTSVVKVPECVRKSCFSKPWVVYSVAPVCGVDKTLEYIARYAYRVAISNERIRSVDSKSVAFDYKDYRDEGKVKQMTLGGIEFVRRYAMHILPENFVRIRHFGILATACRDTLRDVQAQLGSVPVPKKRARKGWQDICRVKGLDIDVCPSCGLGHLMLVATIPRIRSPQSESRLC